MDVQTPVLKEAITALLQLPDDKLQEAYEFLMQLGRAPKPHQYRTARELRQLPIDERNRILREQAKAAAPYYIDRDATAERLEWQAGDIMVSDDKYGE